MKETPIIDPKSVYQQQEGIVAREIMDEFILVPVSQELSKMHSFFTLNNVGRFIWDQLDGVNNLNSIVEALEDEYDVDELTARNDVNQLIEELVQAGLIVPVSTEENG